MVKIGNHHGVWRSHEKVSFNFAIEVSYVYIWVDKRSLKMPKMVLKTLCLQSNSVTRHDGSLSKGQKWFENSKIKWDISSYFQRVWIYLWISVASFSNDPFIETINSSYSWRNSIGVVVSVSNARARVTKTCQWKIQKYEYDKKMQHFAK